MPDELSKEVAVQKPMNYSAAQELLKSWDLLTREVLGKAIVIRSYEHIEAYDKPALLVDIELGDQNKKLLINSTVLMKELIKVQSYLPIVTTVKKHKNYFIFT